MALASGTKLGPYEIIAPLGAGGMGEVYRARDTRLDRDVAVKVLPANLSSEPNLRQRLEREAKAVSKLSHPHICTLHDIGHQDGMDFLVMELVEGETLEQRLTKGPLSSEQTVRYAAQIADALAKAHKKGLTHRDLKPANIMLTRSGAKLMDFGLAKQAGPAPLAAALTETTMEQSKLTGEGTIVGTFQYMAPEQLEGKEADARTDIFALGELIYEMATGKPAFSGKSRASLIAAILTAEPPSITQLQPLTPLALERVVRRCLAKDPEERWQSASDLASELKWIGEAGSRAATTLELGARRKRRGVVIGVAVALLGGVLVGALLFVVMQRNGSDERGRTIRFTLAPPEKSRYETDMALSRDGRQLAFVVRSAGKSQIWLRSLNAVEARPLAGTENGSQPFWSPDGRYLGFFAEGKLKKVDWASGAVQTLCDAPDPRGGAWSQNGVILFSPRPDSPLYRVPAEGGAPLPVTALDASEKEASNRWPNFLPDGHHFLYMAYHTGAKRWPIWLASLDSKDKRRILESISMVKYMEPGYLVYVREHSLVAQGFETKGAELRGDPLALAESVEAEGESGITGRASFTAADGGVLAYVMGEHQRTQLTWFDRKGRALGMAGPPADYSDPAMSRDGKYLAVSQGTGSGRNIWVRDLMRGTESRLTFGSAESDLGPVWTPDGKRIVFSSNQKGHSDLYWKPSNGTGKEDLLFSSDLDKFADDVSRDGHYLIFETVSGPGGRSELWVLPLMGERKPEPYLQTEAYLTHAVISPDGHWVAYSSNESGGQDIFVQSFPEAGAKFQISKDGGDCPLWRDDGKELFYLGGSNGIVAVPVETSPTFRAGAPQTLFQVPLANLATQPRAVFAIPAGEQRILVNQVLEESNRTPITVVVNWAAELKRN